MPHILSNDLCTKYSQKMFHGLKKYCWMLYIAVSFSYHHCQERGCLESQPNTSISLIILFMGTPTTHDLTSIF